MTIQELGTIFQSKIPVKIVLLNNSFLGMVRQWQQLFFGKRYSFTHIESPDLTLIAAAYGIPNRRVTEPGQLREAIEELAAERVPINATEVMSVRQTLDVCEVYPRAIRGLHAPPRCIFPISPASSMNISQRVPYGMASIFPRTTCGRRVLRWLKKSTRPFGKTRRPWALSAAAPVGCTTLPKWLAARRLLPSTGRVPRKN